MSRVRDLPEIITLDNDDLFYVVDDSAGPNGGRKIKKSSLGQNIEHGELLGLSDDDHLQYLRTDGTRVMTGDLNLGTNDIDNVGLVDGIDVTAHGTRHNPGGADPVTTAAASTLTPDLANAEGNATSLARSNHIHNVPTGTPVDTGTANSAGSGSTFAKNDHVHKTVVSNLYTSATADATTTSLTDVLLTGMSFTTPTAGDYWVSFSSSSVNSGNGAERNYISIYVGGVQQTATEVRMGVSGGAVVPVSTQAKVTVNGSQDIAIHWRVAGGTGTMYQRTFGAVRLN